MRDGSKCIMVVLALVVLAEVAAQSPPPKPKPKPDSTAPQKSEEAPPSKVVATLLVKVDEACELSLNGRVLLSAAAGESEQLPVQEFGEQLLEAKTGDGVVWSQLITIEKPGQKFIQTEIAVVRARLESERQQREAEERKVAEEQRLRKEVEARWNRGEAVVRDPLMWIPKDNGSNVNWHEANGYCERLSFGGFDDWRLPTIDELQGLHDPTVSGRDKIIESISLTSCCPWSSTKGSSSSAWNFHFSNGVRYSSYLDISPDKRALCVRRSGG